MAVHDATSPRHHIWIFNTYSLYCDPHSPFKLRAIMCMHRNRRQVTLTSWSLSTHQSHLVITAAEVTGNSTVCSTVCLSSRLYITGPLWQVTDGFPSQRATIPVHLHISMMTSSNGNIFRVTGHLCGEFTGPRWISRTKASDWHGALMFSLICVWINDWVNNREAGDLRRYRAHYDVIVMITVSFYQAGDELNACPVGILNANNARFFPKANVDSFVESLNW